MYLFLGAITLLAWNLAGYPAYVALVARTRGERRLVRNRAIRSVTAIVAAHNEERCISARVRNILANGSWRPVEVIVVSDGSTDGTASLAGAAGARVIEQERSGKIAALKKAIANSTGDAIVLTDANTRFEPGALDALIEPLEDDSVGIAAGDLRFENDAESDSAAGESLYWTYETWIKRNASDAGLLLMGAGGIYALRREDWPEELPDDLADDSYVPLRLHRDGKTNVFVPAARAFERAGVEMSEEWRRRVRMVAQDARVCLALRFGMPNARTCFALVSQKVLRWLLFPLGMSAFLSSGAASIAMRRRGGFLRAFAIPLRFALPAAGAMLGAGAVARHQKRSVPVVSVAFYLTGATAAAFVGLLLGLSGRSRATWDKAPSTRNR